MLWGMDTVITPPTSYRGTRYDQDCRRKARELWAFVHSRNGEAVARAMQEEYPGIEGRTIRRWAEEDEWAAWVDAAIVDLAPHIHRSMVVDLILGAAESSRILRAMQRGELPPDPVKARICFGFMDRVGFTPRTSGEPLAPPKQGRYAKLTAADIDSMSEAELDALESGEDEEE